MMTVAKQRDPISCEWFTVIKQYAIIEGLLSSTAEQVVKRASDNH